MDADLPYTFTIMTRGGKNLTLSFPPKNHSSSTTRKYALWGRVTYILHLCQKDMSLACWVKIMGWDGVPWRRWPGEVTGSDHICAPCCPCTKLGTNSKIPMLPGKKRRRRKHSSAFPWGHPECDPLLKLNSIFDLLNERKGDRCQPRQFFTRASLLSTRIILELSHGMHPVRGENLQALWSLSRGMCSVWSADSYQKHSQLSAPSTPPTWAHTCALSFQPPIVLKVIEFGHYVCPLWGLV